MLIIDYKQLVAIILAAIALIGTLSGIAKDSLYEKPEVIVDIEEKSENDDLRIMSFNIRCTNVGLKSWVQRIDIVAETINKAMPDSVGLQEATPGWMLALEDKLELYAYVGVGRDDGEKKGEYSLIFYLKDKYTLVESGWFWLSETPEVPSKGWDASLNRICTWAVLRDNQTAGSYMHINSHFDHLGVSARRHSVEMILDFASRYPDLPVVFTADMNIREGAEPYNILENSGILKDAKFLAPDTMDYLTFHDTKPSLNEGKVIDFIFVNELLDPSVYRVVTAGINGEYVSDHFPLYCDMSFNTEHNE